MTTLTYPSAQFPGPPSISVDIPEGWSAVRVPGTLLAARRAGTDGRFAPNVVVRGFTRSGDFTIGRALAELRSYVQDRTDGQMDAPYAHAIEQIPFVGVNVSWSDERVGDVVQAHLFAGARRGQVVDLIQVTGSVGGEQAGSEYVSLQRLMQTVRVTR
jgi:hypothetical protein